MEIKQIYELVNNATKEILGVEDLLQEDLSNVVEVGTAIFNASAFDAYVKSLVNHIGKVIFVNRPYAGSAPSVMMDSWEYGSVMEKVRATMPEAVENESWELEDGASYDPNVFHKPQVSAKFFNKMTTFEVDASITEKQVKQSFSSAGQLNSFVSMLFNEVEKSMTVKNDSLIMRTINNFIGETMYDAYSSAGSYAGVGNCRAVNLLKLYNDMFSKSLTAEQALYDPDFLRFAAYRIGVVMDRLPVMSTLFNIGGQPRFTPKDKMHLVMLSDFAKGADVYLQSSVYHNEYTKLAQAETVPYWQGSGDGYDFDDITGLYIKTADGHDVQASGIIATIFDREALGVCNVNSRVNTNYNPKAEFTNYFYKRDARYFNDFDENGVVFFLAAES